MKTVLEAVRANERDLALVLGGGNALGAYHLGAVEFLYEQGLEPSRIVGASIGAVTAAILAGAEGGDRIQRLRTFWRQVTQPDLTPLPNWALGLPPSESHALRALLYGRPGLFEPRFPGLWTLMPWGPDDIALRDHRPLLATLERLIDFDRLNAGPLRVSIVALDMETGEEVWFDNRRAPIEPAHLLACTALSPLFPPVEIDGRLLCDAGFANNLPLDHIFETPSERDLLCLAVDLYSLQNGRPHGINGALARVQDLGFASQTRRAVAALRREHALRNAEKPSDSRVALALLAYRGAAEERAGKSLDFSASALARRSGAGRADMAATLARLEKRPADRSFDILDCPSSPDA